MGGDDELAGLGSVPERRRSRGEVVFAIVTGGAVVAVMLLATVRDVVVWRGWDSSLEWAPIPPPVLTTQIFEESPARVVLVHQ